MIRLLFVLLGTSLCLQSSPSINQDVYDYLWEGVTTNIHNGGCTIWTKQYERFAIGMSPIPQHSEFTKFTNTANCYLGALAENRWTWSDIAMTAGSWSTYLGGVYQNGGSCVCAEKRPQRILEVANYANKTQAGSSYKFNRLAWGDVRFWVNSVQNQLYHFKITMTGGWWSNWWPGSQYPGDIFDDLTPDTQAFNYVNDHVLIRGIQCNQYGEVTLYWNPYGGRTLECDVLVNNATKAQHYWYQLEMEIIP